MQGYKIHVSGRWAQFRKPETNNNPLTHDFITKSALIGMMGAVLGKERSEMRSLFPILSTDLLYGVQINRTIRKESWAFTMRNVHNQNNPSEKAPRQMEFLRDPDFTLMIALQNERSNETFTNFGAAIRNSEALFTPVLGLHNCPATLEWIQDHQLIFENGEYSSKGFVLRSHPATGKFDFNTLRLGFDRVPTFQNEDWWNLPVNYVEVIYPSNGTEITVSGEHYRTSTGETWCLI